jgi:PhnB protein
MNNAHHIRRGYHAITPSFMVRDAKRAMDWYRRHFGATEVMMMEDSSGTVIHAELRIDDSVFMLGEFNPEYNKADASIVGTPVVLSLYVADVDAVVTAAVEDGATIIFPVEDHFYGDRSGRIRDPFGILWIVSTPKEEIGANEMLSRFEKIIQESK